MTVPGSTKEQDAQDLSNSSQDAIQNEPSVVDEDLEKMEPSLQEDVSEKGTKVEAHADLKMSQENDDLVLRARGLPWSATIEDVEDFFSGCEIKGGAQNGVHFTFSRDGRPSGECFVEFATVGDCEKALLKNNEHMGKRYVEVFESKHSEMDWVCKRMGVTSKEPDTETVVRLRGLPFGCSKEEVANFFKGLEIAPNGITIAHDEEGKNTGDAFVEFASPDIASQAMNKHKEKIGHRYIEIFHSNIQEARSALLPKPKPLMSARFGPYDRKGGFGGSGRFGAGQVASGFERRYRGGRGGFGASNNDFGGFGGNMRGGRGGRGGFGGGGGGGGGGFGGGGGGGGRSGAFGGDDGGLAKSTTGHCVHMRGLPFSASESDIKQWFMPLNPVAIRMEFETSGSGVRKSSGKGDVDFASDADAKAAMTKDRQMMGHRYIELFLRSEYDDGETDWSGEQSFFSGNGMNFSNAAGGGFGSNFGNSGAGGNGNFGGGGGGGNYGGGYGGTSGQGGNFANQGTTMGAGTGAYGMQGGGQGGGGAGSMLGNMASAAGGGGGFSNQAMAGQGMGAQGMGGNGIQSGLGGNQSGYQQGSGYTQTNQAQQSTSNFTATSAGAFNSAGSFYGQDSKTGMVSYPTTY